MNHAVLTNSVHCNRNEWVEHYPPMNTACSKATVVSTSDGSHVFVIEGSDKWTTNVELFHVVTEIWYELVYLPPPLFQPSSATICGNQLHVVGHMLLDTHAPFKLYHPVTSQ